MGQSIHMRGDRKIAWSCGGKCRPRICQPLQRSSLRLVPLTASVDGHVPDPFNAWHVTTYNTHVLFLKSPAAPSPLGHQSCLSHSHSIPGPCPGLLLPVREALAVTTYLLCVTASGCVCGLQLCCWDSYTSSSSYQLGNFR